MARDGAKPSKHQYAIGHKNGCLKVIHQVRKKLEELMEEHPDEDWVAVKIDISNAFNALMRRAVRGTLEGHDDLIQQYFRLAYGGASPLVVYGPGTFEILRMEEGIRQGDSTSTYLFCALMEWIALGEMKTPLGATGGWVVFGSLVTLGPHEAGSF